MSSRAVNAAFSLVYLALATRTLGLEGFGQFGLIVLLGQALCGLASFSTWQGIVRWSSEPGGAAMALGFAVALDAASIAAGAVLAALACWSLPLWLPLPADLRLTAFALCLAMLLASRSTPVGVLRVHDRFDLAAAAEAILPATRAVGAGVAVLFWPTPGGFVAVWALAELACAAVHWRLALRLEPIDPALVSLRLLPARHKDAWRFSWGTNLSRSLAVSGRHGVQLLVGALGGAALAGGFRVAAQIGLALVQLAEAVSRALYPELVRVRDAAGRLAWQMAGTALAIGTVAASMSALAGERLLALLAGPDFGFAAPAMALMAAGGAMELAAASFEALLVARGNPGLALGLRIAPLALALAALPLGIAWHGLAGAAACLASASLITVLLMAWAARQPIRADLAR